MKNITVILNCYKRPEYLKQQIESIRNQTVDVDDIFIWYNKPEDGNQYDITDLGCKVATCNHNFKFHGRFAYGLLARSEYVAFFDDDTIPAPKWFENCLNTIENGYDGILGSAGVYLEHDVYKPHTKIGWNGVHSESVRQVDLVGHAWFMRRDYLKYLWYDEPISWENGEDIQLSYLAKKYGNVDTFVPPHPESNKDIWGGIHKFSHQYGNDTNASWKVNSDHLKLRNEIVSKTIENGYIPVRKR